MKPNYQTVLPRRCSASACLVDISLLADALCVIADLEGGEVEIEHRDAMIRTLGRVISAHAMVAHESPASVADCPANDGS